MGGLLLGKLFKDPPKHRCTISTPKRYTVMSIDQLDELVTLGMAEKIDVAARHPKCNNATFPTDCISDAVGSIERGLKGWVRFILPHQSANRIKNLTTYTL